VTVVIIESWPCCVVVGNWVQTSESNVEVSETVTVVSVVLFCDTNGQLKEEVEVKVSTTVLTTIFEEGDSSGIGDAKIVSTIVTVRVSAYTCY
jgi:hypothetical protein